MGGLGTATLVIYTIAGSLGILGLCGLSACGMYFCYQQGFHNTADEAFALFGEEKHDEDEETLTEETV